MDRLDGIIDEAYWMDVSAKWREEQTAVRSRIDRLEKADHNYVDQGVRILELAQSAYSLYKEQEPLEKRKLLPRQDHYRTYLPVVEYLKKVG